MQPSMKIGISKVALQFNTKLSTRLKKILSAEARPKLSTYQITLDINYRAPRMDKIELVQV